MLNTNGFNNIKAWSLFGFSTAGMVIFALLYFFNPETKIQTHFVTNSITNTVTQFVTNTMTNVVVKEVPKEVEKIVNVPASIPQEYIAAVRIISNFDNCDFVKDNQALFGMKDVQVLYFLEDDVKESVSEDEVRTKFELTLRKNNVPVSPTSKNYVTVNVEGFWNDPPSRGLLAYTIEVSVYEKQTLLRGRQIHKAIVRVWGKNWHGTVGRYKAKRSLLDQMEGDAEVFANDFLSANPKQ